MILMTNLGAVQSQRLLLLRLSNTEVHRKTSKMEVAPCYNTLLTLSALVFTVDTIQPSQHRLNSSIVMRRALLVLGFMGF